MLVALQLRRARVVSPSPLPAGVNGPERTFARLRGGGAHRRVGESLGVWQVALLLLRLTRWAAGRAHFPSLAKASLSSRGQRPRNASTVRPDPARVALIGHHLEGLHTSTPAGSQPFLRHVPGALPPATQCIPSGDWQTPPCPTQDAFKKQSKLPYSKAPLLGGL